MQRHYFVNKGPSSQGYGFSSSHVWMWELDYKKSWALKNWFFWTVMLEKTLESPLGCKEIQPVHPKESVLGIHWKDWCWSWNANILVTWCKELTYLKRPWCWERLKAGGEGDDREWDSWMASPTQWTWLWVDSGSWWWTGRAWRAVVHVVAKIWTWLSDWTVLNLMLCLDFCVCVHICIIDFWFAVPIRWKHCIRRVKKKIKKNLGKIRTILRFIVNSFYVEWLNELQDRKIKLYTKCGIIRNIAVLCPQFLTHNF